MKLFAVKSLNFSLILTIMPDCLFGLVRVKLSNYKEQDGSLLFVP